MLIGLDKVLSEAVTELENCPDKPNAIKLPNGRFSLIDTHAKITS